MLSATGEKPTLALYDFRSKQEYIYRTNRMREITGASELIAGMYDRFLESEPRIIGDWDQDVPLSCEFKEGIIGKVVYIGGGNLCVLYKSVGDYIECNKRFSRMVLEEARGLSLLASCADWTGDFEESRSNAYRALDIQKRVGATGSFSNVLPFTLVDRASFQAIISRSFGAEKGEYTQESLDKRESFSQMEVRHDEERFIDEIAADRGRDSLIAVVYFDGNSIGNRLKSDCKTVADMRRFSRDVHAALVENTEVAIKDSLGRLDEKYRGYRVIIDHGDEITLICNAHAAPFALDAYFEALKDSGYEACAGMAICHSHDPFASVYEIAEECCESGKKANRRAQGDSSYIDFHFCRSGITGSLDQIRDSQESGMTSRPYKVGGSYQTFLAVGEALAKSEMTRSDIKELNRCMARGESWYRLEYERLKAKSPSAFATMEALADGESLKRVLFDVTSFYDVYDLRFSGTLDLDSDEGVKGGIA